MSISCNRITIAPLIGVTLLLLSSHFVAVQSDTDLITQTCHQTPYYDLCISSLESDPRSAGADVKGLALIMVDELKARATKTVGVINILREKKPELKQPLSSCSSKYDAILKADIPEAVEALEKGDFKFAEGGLNDSAREADSCEGSFHGQSPLTDANKAVHDVSVIAAAIVKTLL